MTGTTDKTHEVSKRSSHASDTDTSHTELENVCALTIMRPAREVYSFWRDLNNLPRFMDHLVSIGVKSETLSHWNWKALRGGMEAEWDSEITQDIPNKLIAWRSVAGSEVAHEGFVRFEELPFDRGTVVHVEFSYHPPGGKLGDLVEKMLFESPEQTLKADLRRLRMLLEAGEVPTTDGQPKGGLEETTNPALHH